MGLMDKSKNSNDMKDKIKEICNKLNREQLSVHGATEELLILFSVVSSDFCEEGKHEVMADNGYCGICNKKIGCVV